MILEGVTVPLITPLNEDQSLDHESLARTIDHVVSGGVDAIFVLGTSGEFANLSRKTKDELVVTAKSLIGERVKYYVGIARASAGTTVEEGEYIQSLGVDIDAFVTLPPLYYAYNQAELVQHFTSIADRLSLPITIYNIPGLVRQPVTAEVVEHLAAHPNIAGIKNTCMDMLNFRNLMTLKESYPDFMISQGHLFNVLECLVYGANGLTLGVGTLVPHWCTEMYQAVKKGDRRTAADIFHRLLHIDPIGIKGSWSAGLKAQCAMLGLCKPHLSVPFEQVSDADRSFLRQKLVDVGLLAE
jgi:4-hydroxy-tetrahydrodipicolinate synthase